MARLEIEERRGSSLLLRVMGVAKRRRILLILTPPGCIFFAR